MSDSGGLTQSLPWRERPWLRSWDWIWPCLILLIVGAGLRWSTFNIAERYMTEASRRLAYSDVFVFYNPANPFPYFERQVEYPPLTGLALWGASLAPGGKQGYFLASALLLSVALVGTFVLLRQAGPGTVLPYFALAPGLAFYGTLNWDALAVVALIGAIIATRRGRFALAGIALGLGVSAKLFPLYIVPALLAHTLVVGNGDAPRRFGLGTIAARLIEKAPRRFIAGFASTLLAINLPFAILAPSGWSYFLRFQAGREKNLDSIWRVLPATPDRAQSVIFAALFLGGVAWSSWRVLRGANWEWAALFALLAFLIPTKVYSPQYDLWLLPLFALLAAPLWLWLLFVVVDAVYYWAIFNLFANGDWSALDKSIWAREIVLLLIAGWAGWHLMRRAAPRDRLQSRESDTPRSAQLALRHATGEE